MSDYLSFEDLRRVNATRVQKWHPPGSIPWSSSDWSNAMCGEAGETANKIKKIRRHETGCVNDGDPPIEVLKTQAVEEMADTVIYLDLLALHLGMDLGEAVRNKFNKTSERFGFPERL